MHFKLSCEPDATELSFPNTSKFKRLNRKEKFIHAFLKAPNHTNSKLFCGPRWLSYRSPLLRLFSHWRCACSCYLLQERLRRFFAVAGRPALAMKLVDLVLARIVASRLFNLDMPDPQGKSPRDSLESS